MLFDPPIIPSRGAAFWLGFRIVFFSAVATVLIAGAGTYLTGGVNLEVIKYGLLISLILVSVFAYFIIQTFYDVMQVRDEFTRVSRRDELTQLCNRRAFFENARTLMDRSDIGSFEISVIMVDVDLFKKVNDHFGHQAGDAALVAVANILRSAMPSDRGVAGRIGGEEFALLFIDPSRDEGARLCEKIRSETAAAAIREGGNIFNITVSIGHTIIAARESVETGLTRADKALYTAKHLGRDKVVSAPPDRT